MWVCQVCHSGHFVRQKNGFSCGLHAADKTFCISQKVVWLGGTGVSCLSPCIASPHTPIKLADYPNHPPFFLTAAPNLLLPCLPCAPHPCFPNLLTLHSSLFLPPPLPTPITALPTTLPFPHPMPCPTCHLLPAYSPRPTAFPTTTTAF